MGIIDRPNELLRVVREMLGLKVEEYFTIEGVNHKYYFTEQDIMVEYRVLKDLEQKKSNIPLLDLCHKRIERVE